MPAGVVTVSPHRTWSWPGPGTSSTVAPASSISTTVPANPPEMRTTIPSSTMTPPVGRDGALAGIASDSGRSPRNSRRKGEGRDVGDSTVVDSEARVIATWSTRRSSSMSSDNECGMRPRSTPNTTMWGHSRPFTLWIVVR